MFKLGWNLVDTKISVQKFTNVEVSLRCTRMSHLLLNCDLACAEKWVFHWNNLFISFSFCSNFWRAKLDLEMWEIVYVPLLYYHIALRIVIQWHQCHSNQKRKMNLHGLFFHTYILQGFVMQMGFEWLRLKKLFQNFISWKDTNLSYEFYRIGLFRSTCMYTGGPLKIPGKDFFANFLDKKKKVETFSSLRPLVRQFSGSKTTRSEEKNHTHINLDWTCTTGEVREGKIV